MQQGNSRTLGGSSALEGSSVTSPSIPLRQPAHALGKLRPGHLPHRIRISPKFLVVRPRIELEAVVAHECDVSHELSHAVDCTRVVTVINLDPARW
jgi:hypothetical protein